MAAKQNVLAAVSSGWLAVAAGVAAVAVSFALVPVISRIGSDNPSGPVAGGAPGSQGEAGHDR